MSAYLSLHIYYPILVGTDLDLAPCLHVITHMDLGMSQCLHIIAHMDMGYGSMSVYWIWI